MKFFKFLISKFFFIQIAIALVISVLLLFGIIKFLNIYTLQNQKIEVPNLKGLTLDEVKIVLQDIKLRHEVIDYGTYNPDLPKESILNQLPLAGDIVKQNRRIYLTINPKNYANAPIPSFYGKTDKEIRPLLKNSGFKIGIYDSIDDLGIVVRKLKFNDGELKEGDMLPKNSIIDIVIGNGKLSDSGTQGGE